MKKPHKELKVSNLIDLYGIERIDIHNSSKAINIFCNSLDTPLVIFGRGLGETYEESFILAIEDAVENSKKVIKTK